ncbi:hypothetical protein [Streptomyces sp. NPDC002619]|uniref:hypothetical protein n=1 Tax=Streptomyces sp. NPDC002619 TaxID=3364655 RepID=UPI0036985012
MPTTSTAAAPSASSPVKENRSALFAQLDALDWNETTNATIAVHRTEETNSGRHEIRIVRVQPLAPGQVNFPHATRALLIERYTTGRGDGKIHADAELDITTAPSDVADTAVLARCVRGQWAIEAQHFVRDVTFGEHACRTRTGNLPRALATFRSLAISPAHLAGWTNNAAAHDHYRNHPADPYSNSVSPDEHASRLPLVALVSPDQGDCSAEPMVVAPVEYYSLQVSGRL